MSETAHPRRLLANRYVYAVLSRRAGGVSVGINLNPDRACNFDCLYCQVDRRGEPTDRFVDQLLLAAELKAVLTALRPGGELWGEPAFAGLPPEKRRVADVAFSGDGEPTAFRDFSRVVRTVAGIKDGFGFRDARLVLITNASGLARLDVKRALEIMDAHRGEVWAKLDAGTPPYFHLVNRTAFPFAKILANILACARQRPIVIQSCFMRVRGQGPAEAEIAAYLQRLRELRAGGGQVRLVQVCTVARPPAFGVVSSLTREEVDALAARVTREAGLPAQAFYGEVPEGQGIMGEEPVDNQIEGLRE